MAKRGWKTKFLYVTALGVWGGMVALYGVTLGWPLAVRALPYFIVHQQPQCAALVLGGIALLAGVLVCLGGLLLAVLQWDNYSQQKFPAIGPRTLPMWGDWLRAFWRVTPQVARRWLGALLSIALLTAGVFSLLLVLARAMGMVS